jgi:hypothetical protein
MIKATALRHIIEDIKKLRDYVDVVGKREYTQIIGTLTMRLLEYDDEMNEPPLRKS